MRELEAWLLVDKQVFAELGLTVELPSAPDHASTYYRFFGEQVSFEKLRRLSAFREFEAELTQVLQSFSPRAS